MMTLPREPTWHIEVMAQAIYDNPPPPASSAIDWIELTTERREIYRHAARAAYAALVEHLRGREKEWQ